MFTTTIHWVKDIEPYRLGLMARPRGGDWLQDEVAAWRDASMGIVVSLLESHEVRGLELEAEQSLCSSYGIDFRRFPIPDRGAPGSMKQAAVLVADLHANLVQGKAVAVHCRAGIGRTGLVAGALLHKLFVPREHIFRMLGRSRGVDMPDTAAQVDWLDEFTRTFPNSPRGNSS
jgi:protein-tyrosine phosphatase